MKQCRSFGHGMLVAILLSGLWAPGLTGQVREDAGMVATGLLLRQMDGVKRVLMIGAHPDDEDTAFLTTMARSWGAETAYLSLTRGDGGQNLIGPELWEGLGVIRTGELEAARRIDGGIQFFTRAFDFGYSKTAEEALTFWPRDEVLADVVWVVRTFRPHVIVSVWTGTTRDGHGQHTASGILAHEAFQAAADPQRFPEQFARGVEPWSAAKLYETRRRNIDQATVLVDAGGLDPLLGHSAYQISRQSRSQHRSQDMGASQPLGPQSAGAALVESRVGGGAEQGLFEGIDTALVSVTRDLPPRVAAAAAEELEGYREALQRARAEFGLEPGPVLGPLRDAVAHLNAASAAVGGEGGTEIHQVLGQKLELATRALMAAAGVVVDLRSEDDLVTPGQTVALRLLLWNGGGARIERAVPDLRLPEGWTAEVVESSGVEVGGGVASGQLAEWRFRVTLPEDAELSRLYFLERPRDGDMYRWPDDEDLWGLPRDPAPVRAAVAFALDAAGGATPVQISLPWRYVGVEQASGEFYEPVLVVPQISVQATPQALVWPQVRRESATVTVTVRNDAPSARTGTVRLDVPPDWSVVPEEQPFHLDSEGTERTVSFQVAPTGTPVEGEHVLRAVARTEDGTEYVEGAYLIDYEHIERAAMFPEAETRITVVPVRVADGLRVGYVMGTGDDGPEAIRQLGAEVELLGSEAVREGAFHAFDAVVLGVRAYETREDLRAANAQLLDYARAGGTVVVQYNQYQFSRGGYAPHFLEIGRPAPRVADQTAPVTILEPGAPVFTTPNLITQQDFEGWAQERGLYFLSQWDEAFMPLLEMNDPGEPPRRGSLLVSQVGEGLYVYAALSFFRQFPSGVPGAYRLFANLISLSPGDWAAFLDSRAGSAGGR